MDKLLRVALVGATGGVGENILALLAERRFPLRRLSLLASGNSAGRRVPFRGGELVIEDQIGRASCRERV